MSELISAIYKDIDDRKVWADKQRRWYKMRYDGLGRVKLPWPTASNLHYAVADININGFRPYYIEQIYSSDTLARFIPKDSDVSKDKGVMAGQIFSYQLKERSNFETEMRIGIDKHLMQDVCPVQIRYDDKGKKIEFEALDPLDLIVPGYTKDIQDADRIVRVIELSKEAYKDSKYNQEEWFVEKACGGAEDDRQSREEWEKDIREGLQSYADRNDIILLWEVYQKKGGKIKVSTWSPFIDDTPAQAEHDFLYNHGEYPFEILVFEKTDKGYYSSRGITQIVAPEEDVATKILNEQMDRFTLTNRPMFTTDAPIPNEANVKMKPNQILPFNMRVVEMPVANWDYKAEIAAVVQRANDRVGSPDAGITDTAQPLMNPRTKFEVSQIAGLNGAKIGDRGRLFRKSLARIYKQAWSLMVQFKSDLNLDYLIDDSFKKADPELMNDIFHIEPSASADGLTKEMELQKALMRWQMWTGSPFANQGELAKDVMVLDDPSFAKRVYIDPKFTEQNQAQRQQEEIVLMRNGFQVDVKPDDVDEIHLNVLLATMAQEWSGGKPAIQVFKQYEPQILDHLERLKQNKPDEIYNAYRKKFNDMVEQDMKIQREIAMGSGVNGRASVQVG